MTRRREYLTVIGSSIAAGLAGCSTKQSNNSSEESSAGSTPTQTAYFEDYHFEGEDLVIQLAAGHDPVQVGIFTGDGFWHEPKWAEDETVRYKNIGDWKDPYPYGNHELQAFVESEGEKQVLDRMELPLTYSIDAEVSIREGSKGWADILLKNSGPAPAIINGMGFADIPYSNNLRDDSVNGEYSSAGIERYRKQSNQNESIRNVLFKPRGAKFWKRDESEKFGNSTFTGILVPPRSNRIIHADGGGDENYSPPGPFFQAIEERRAGKEISFDFSLYIYTVHTDFFPLEFEIHSSEDKQTLLNIQPK